MKQPDFLVWMLGYPIVSSFSELVTEHFIGRTFTADIYGIAAAISLVIYFSVGMALWNKDN